MLNFFRSKTQEDGPVTHNIELVSVHIPKTAGTSFRHTLKEIYGEKAIIRLDIPGKGNRIKIDKKEFTRNNLSAAVRVAHGHFSPSVFARKFEEKPNLTYITWLRNPVDRVISNYYYLAKRLSNELKEDQKGVNLIKKVMQRSLLEYANAQINRNRMSTFVKGRDLESFDFVGIQEYYEEDLAALAELMGWPPPPLIKRNITGSDRDISEEDRQQIAEWNEADMELYERGLALRATRIQG